MKLFRLTGIKSPGRVDIYMVGQIDLEIISDEMAEKLWLNGCKFLTPTDEGRKKFFPDQVEIKVEPIPTARKTTRKNSEK
jgi:hypothetical protein